MKRVTRGPAVDLTTKVAFLSRPDSYDGRTTTVEPIETHMAWVFLTDTRAYKLKKPVRFPYLDFSTLSARARMCREEVRLNRRLAPGVYLGVVPLGLDDGRLRLGTGAVVDWLVEMRKLPRELMLDRLAAAGEVPMDRVASLGRTLAEFYAGAPRVRTSGPAYVDRLQRDLDEVVREVPRYGGDEARLREASDALRTFLARRGALLEHRAVSGAIVEGHGDLRPEHICLTPAPVVIDCIEFNRAFRTVDPVDDLAYLALECRRLGRPDIGAAVLDEYTGVTGDHAPGPLVRFYECFRAALRAKIALWHLRDDHRHERDHWIARGNSYLALAQSMAALMSAP